MSASGNEGRSGGGHRGSTRPVAGSGPSDGSSIQPVVTACDPKKFAPTSSQILQTSTTEFVTGVLKKCLWKTVIWQVRLSGGFNQATPSTKRNSIATYSLIYSFLTERSHFKAAEAVKKAVKGVIEIKGGDKDGPTLPVILNQWKRLTAVQGKKATAPYVWYWPTVPGSKLTTQL